MEQLALLFKRHYDVGLPAVLYHLPEAPHITLLRQENRSLCQIRDYRESGFVFAPFDPGGRPLFIRPDHIDREAFHGSPGEGDKRLAERQPEPAEKQDFIELVERAKAHIARGMCRKIVVSRKTTLPFKGSPLSVFKALLSYYPSACCYLWFHPDTGIWLGASPELLLEVASGTFRTVSLAGTRDGAIPSPGWGMKEVTEQQLVTDYIRSALQPLVASLHIHPSRTVRAGSLFHLESGISGDTGDTGIAQLVHALHPTPAVCGLPRETSLTFIQQEEGYDREYYSGFLGELNLPQSRNEKGTENCRLFVNLRCMSLANGRATLFVGGGITAESSPESEWEETLGKESTMRRGLFNSAG